MIIIDTNVFSELLKLVRSQDVVDWLDAQIVETLYFAAPSLAELRFGIETLPAGKRKDLLNSETNTLIATFFHGRILPFDRESALVYGQLVGSARTKGRTVSVTDGQIGAIAKVYGFTVATRDTAPFEALELPVVNPWKL